MKKKQPLISVIMPVYNAQDFLVDAIESILNQTYRNFELIMVDDASTDRSPAILKSYKKRFPKKIRVITLAKNLNRGGDTCANKALKVAKGELIARMDADDIAHPERLAKQVAYLTTHPRTFLVGTNAFVINKEGDIIGDKTEPCSPKAIQLAYFTFHPLIHPSCMFRRLLKDGTPFAYQITYSANNDYNTFFTLLCQGYRFANLKEKLMFYRIHGKNDTFVKMKEKFMNTIKIRIKMVRSYGYRPTMKAIAINIAQSIVLFTLPQEILTGLYLVSKGINSPKSLLRLPQISFAMHFNFLKATR